MIIKKSQYYLFLTTFLFCLTLKQPIFSRQYVQYNIYNLMLNNKDYHSVLGSGSITIGGSEKIIRKSFFEFGIFIDMSFFRFEQIKTIKEVEEEIEGLAKKIKPKIINEKNNIIQEINQLQDSYDSSIINLKQIPGNSESEMHAQINQLYKDLISYDNYEKQLDQKINKSVSNFQDTSNKNNDQRESIKGFINSSTDMIGSFATQTLANSSSQSASKASSIIKGTKGAAAKEIFNIATNAATDIVFDIRNIEARNSFLQEQSQINLERTAVEFQEANIISEIAAIESLKKTDVDSTIHLEKVQNLYNKLDLVKKAKSILYRKEEVTDSLLRIPITLGTVFHFHMFSFLVAYTEIGLILNIDNSITKVLNKIRFGCRLGVGLNFELFSNRFLLGIHFRYWGLENHFISLGPSIGIKI